jgi:hypothetical protein
MHTIATLAGISTGASALGTLSAGAALTTGLIKRGVDKKIVQRQETLQRLHELNDSKEEITNSKAEEIAETVRALMNAESNRELSADQIALEKDKKTSANLGTARTVTSFVAGGTSAVASGTAFAGAFAVDYNKLKSDMRDCEKNAAVIGSYRSQLAELEPNAPELSDMDAIVSSCRGFNYSNIDTVKNTLTAGGIVSAVGTGTGIAGGIVSLKAGQKEKAGASAMDKGPNGTKNLNLAANILAGVTTATSASSALLTGIPLIEFTKNLDKAKDCAGKF